MNIKKNLYLQHVPADKKSLHLLFWHLDQDFPFMRAPFFILGRSMKRDCLHGVYLTDGDKIYGYALYQHVPRFQVVHVLYLAIVSRYRSNGLGGILLEQLNELDKNGILLEVEDPKKANDPEEIRIRTHRIAFYKRNGLKLHPDFKFNHFLFPMRVMANCKLPSLNWHHFYQKLYYRVYRLPFSYLLIRGSSKS